MLCDNPYPKASGQCENCTIEQTELLVRTTFEIVQISEAVRVRDIAKGLVVRLPQVKKTISEIPQEDRKVIKEVMRILLGSGGKTAKLLLIRKELKI